jgi:hypothetical protein
MNVLSMRIYGLRCQSNAFLSSRRVQNSYTKYLLDGYGKIAKARACLGLGQLTTIKAPVAGT